MKIIDRLKKMILEKEKDAHEFEPLLTEIEHNPINPLGNTVFWIVISFILFASLWMYFGKVDVVVTSRGVIIPDGEEVTEELRHEMGVAEAPVSKPQKPEPTIQPVQNPVSFNNTFLDNTESQPKELKPKNIQVDGQQALPQMVPMAPMPPVPMD